MKTSTILKWVTGACEALLGIPFLGGIFILSYVWTPLMVMLILHIITLVFSVKEREKIHGSILGIVASCIGWVPIVGMILHIIAAIALMVDAAMGNRQKRSNIV
ncbi:hypothetical protein [Cytobacillus purgationiresistens]|uniref:Branched-subunit amino acid permease n=1 Tax=Cytobacillus purgationiresistens TaxID=863449 RepID=A0ABU0AGV3_9BACI|nr:hypothetical protein [Cytobacillus purgationiresistens]MDQ0270492.1 putative branched-subunit amino acid permease [Cytobacillus purgationiresistens]